MRIGSSTDKKDSGRIHVDFAQARDDLYEWECKQRLLAREERHRRKVHEDRLRPPSPPPIVHFSEHEAALLAERLKGEDVSAECCSTLAQGAEQRPGPGHLSSSSSQLIKVYSDRRLYFEIRTFSGFLVPFLFYFLVLFSPLN